MCAYGIIYGKREWYLMRHQNILKNCNYEKVIVHGSIHRAIFPGL